MRATLAILGCAGALVAVDLAKPLVIDDAAYHAYARQIAAHPADPYGFEMFWYDAPHPAHEVLAPPIFLYWFAAGLRLLGDHPLLWKAWMLPWALLLTASLAALLRRAAPRVATPMLVAVALSAPILPALNLMLDLPALALGLAGLGLALRAGERDRLPLAVAAGLLAGISLQTKYSALMPLLAALGHLWLARRRAHALVLGAVASAVFVGWELWMLATYGASHFAEGLRQVRAMESPSALHWATATIALLGSGGLGTGLLALHALGASRSRLVAATLLATVGVAAIAFLPGAPIGGGDALFPGWRSELWIFLPLGLGVLAAVGAVVARQVAGLGRPADAAHAPLDRFVLLWLAIEVVGFFVVSPYPALRRLIGVQVAACVAIARAIERQAPRPGLHLAIAWSAALGLLFAVSDVTDARVRASALERAVARLDADRTISPGATRWYVGHWGFQFQAERHGLRPIVPGVSRLAPGDVVVVPSGVYAQPFRVPAASLESLGSVAATNPWPWSTLPWAYSGYPPLRAQPDVQIAVRLGRVVAPTQAR